MIAANVALIAILPATWLPSLRLNLGSVTLTPICLKICKFDCFPQPLHLAQLQPQLLLQPDRRHLPSKVEAIDPGDIWEIFGGSWLHQRVAWTDEASLPWSDGWEGAHNLTCTGFRQPYQFRKVSNLCVSFAGTILQRIWKGHRSCQHLSWEANCVW